MSELQLTGTIAEILPSQSISDGKYNKALFIIKNNDGYEDSEAFFALELFEKSDGDKIANFNKFNKVGDLVDVKYEVRCNENPKKKGQWFTSLSAWRIDKSEGAAPEESSDPEEDPFA